MGHPSGWDSCPYTPTSSTVSRSEPDLEPETDLEWPFGNVDVDHDDLRETAYEIFFAACRASPGFGGRTTLNFYSHENGDRTSPREMGGTNTVTISRMKRALGLKTLKRAPLSPRRMLTSSSSTSSLGSPGAIGSPRSTAPGSPRTPKVRRRRPMTSAELMRQQMRVTEQSDSRLRKTLMKTFAGQMGKHIENIVLPLELLRHLKPSEFNDAHEYYLWQRRQLKILEAGLLQHPSIPLEHTNSYATHLRGIIQASDCKTIDTGKNSETMKNLCNSVTELAWRSPDGNLTHTCHWADGFPLNIHLYLVLLESIFDQKDETAVLDEVDELTELMKKTWSTLGINKLVHNVCFTWLFFQQFVATGQVEQDLLCASLTMMAEVANDAKRSDREFPYVKILSLVLGSVQRWAERKLLDYHKAFQKGATGSMENIIPLALEPAKVLDEDVSGAGEVLQEKETEANSMGNRVEFYIRSSMCNAFSKILESKNAKILSEVKDGDDDDEREDLSEALIQLARETEHLGTREKEYYSCVLKRWQPIAAGVAAVTIHNCYGALLKKYLTGVKTLTIEVIQVLQVAGKLEQALVQMVVEDSVNSEDGGKTMVREMVLYEVETITLDLMKMWIDERLKSGRECLERARDTETWNPKSKTEPHAQSAVEIIQLAKDAVDDFFEIPGMCEDLIQDLADGLESLLQDYTSFASSCGTRQSYIPQLPPLTRCSQSLKILKLWRKASHCKIVGMDESNTITSTAGENPQPSTSRGTQRLYIRVNTLHYLLSSIHSLDKSFTMSIRTHFPNSQQQLTASPSYFELACSSIQSATQHVSEVAAFRLIFLDSKSAFYGGLYVGDVTNARIYPALHTLKQNFTLLTTILINRAQPLAMKEVMKATFEAFSMVLLAGGPRTFTRQDYDMIAEDFGNLKQVFCTCGEGLIEEEVVEREAEAVEGVVALMGRATEQLVEDLSIIACEVSGIGINASAGQKLPMPPTTGRWNRADPNTILRVLCHRNDSVANSFLKKTFQLPKRR